MAEQQHMIGRMSIDIMAPHPGQAAKLQQQLSYRLHTRGFLQQLETMLNTLVKEDEYVEIPLLSVSLQCADDATFNTQLLEKLTAAIKERITKQPSQNILQQGTYATAIRTFFLKYGIRAFYNGQNVLDTLQQEIKSLPVKEQPELETLLKQVGKTHPQVWLRLYYILGAEGTLQFFLRTFACTAPVLQLLISEQLSPEVAGISTATSGTAITTTVAREGQAAQISIPDAILQNARLWQQLFTRVLNEADLVSHRSAQLAMTSNTTNVTGNTRETAQTTADNVVKPMVVSELPLKSQLLQGLQIDNAGLVLLWMDCGRLFRQLGYIAEKQFADEAAQQTAILLLHYIVWGDEPAGEEAWLLNKILCGWQPGLPVDPRFTPDAAAKAAADAMLRTYLENWRKDRQFSIDWLRRSFLQREGQLFARTDDNWLLEVSNRTEDILINKVSMVRYAWMPHILFVRW